MCGIGGKILFKSNDIVPRAHMENMATALRHRGPDDSGVFCDAGIGLAHARLSVLDTTNRGHQPMTDNDGVLYIVYNGEIYNFKDLRAELASTGVTFKSETDTEVVLHMYKKYGPSFVSRLNGMFALAIWDTRKAELFLARDRLGQKPLKYCKTKHGITFSSEIKGLMTDPHVTKAPDWDAIDDYLTYQYIPSPKTGFKNIYKLEPAHYMVVHHDGTILKRRYWDTSYATKKNLSESAWEEEVEESLRSAVRKRLVSDVPLGVFLSGGIDSSLIVALMKNDDSSAIETFSVRFEETSHDEAPYARQVAQLCDTKHHELTVPIDAANTLTDIVHHYEEPLADPSILPFWHLSKFTREHVTVALSGDGGDENFAGYERYAIMAHYYKYKRLLSLIPGKPALAHLMALVYKKTQNKYFRKMHRALSWFNNDPAVFYAKLIGLFSTEEKQRLYTHQMQERVSTPRSKQLLRDYFDMYSDTDWCTQLIATDLHTYLPDDLLVKVDMASMAHSLEVRSPFLDYELVELVASMPAKYKYGPDGDKKYLLKKIAGKYLPLSIVNRPKKGFGIPIEQWMRKDLASVVKKELLDPTFLAYGFQKNEITHMIAEHSAGLDYSRQLWSLLVLRLWLRNWFE